MQEQLGQKLLRQKAVTEEQLAQAVERQRINGGRIGSNLVALGFLSEKELEGYFRRDPVAPASVKETGLEIGFIEDLMLKQMLFSAEFGITDISHSIMLPLSVLDPALERLKREQLIEVKRSAGFMKEAYVYALTEKGRNRAEELLALCRYTGPAPVTLVDYKAMVELQTIKHIVVSDASVREAFSHIVISETLIRRIGPAISSGKAIFLYGPPGNGKTTIAETMGRVLPETVYIPYAIYVGGEIITVFDPISHIPVPLEKDGIDRRWLLIKRPVIMTGGELTLRMLELEFNTVSRFYEAPLQMKANNGLFIVDDFGRQLIEPRLLLNRWIVALERGVDFLSLYTGTKFDIPFDQLVVFSTNIEPRDLVDEAFLRRIRYKIKIGHPSESEYDTIFRRICEANGIRFDKEAFDYLKSNYYKRLNVNLNACHPRDLVDQIIDSAHYHGGSPVMTKETVADAWENYFVEM